MAITHPDDPDGLMTVGRIVANTMQAMARAMEPCMTTRERDDMGAALLEREGHCGPAGALRLSGQHARQRNEEIAHGIPGDRRVKFGDPVNIDVPASLNGYFADTGARFGVGPMDLVPDRLCRDGQRATRIGIVQVGHGKPLAGIGNAVFAFASHRGCTLIRNLASHGVGRALHEEPGDVPTWPTRRDTRRLRDALVLTVEPFLSLGGTRATTGKDDAWTLFSDPQAPAVHYAHRVVATRRGAIVVTLPGQGVAGRTAPDCPPLSRPGGPGVRPPRGRSRSGCRRSPPA